MARSRKKPAAEQAVLTYQDGMPRNEAAAQERVLADGIIDRVRRSALWAAYGDALGWISELTDAKGLDRRTRGRVLTEPIEWTRRIGGRSGVSIKLPAGCYSDDTQLRLATCRAITDHGFDVEVFAKIELPVWLSYALGGGTSTKAAATNLGKPTVPWYANTFAGWTNSGGNGAAMRIQPLVWKSHGKLPTESFVIDVWRNAICTHSHPGGILGAVIHALSLNFVLEHNRVPSSQDMLAFLTEAGSVVQQALNSPDVDTWAGLWAREMRMPFDSSWDQAISDAWELVDGLQTSITDQGAAGYDQALRRLDLYREERRGSGLHTSIAAVALCWLESEPRVALAIAANAIGSDTDTIGTMSGALLGCLTADEPSRHHVLDADLVAAEAERVLGVEATTSPQLVYPDLLRWSAPKSQADALQLSPDGAPEVVGLGPISELVGDPVWAADGQFGWQSARLEIGQTLVIKRRSTLASIQDSNRATVRTRQSREVTKVESVSTSAVLSMPQSSDWEPRPSERNQASDAQSRALDVDAALDFLEREGYNDSAIGRSLRIVLRRGTPIQFAQFIAALASRLETDQ